MANEQVICSQANNCRGGYCNEYHITPHQHNEGCCNITCLYRKAICVPISKPSPDIEGELEKLCNKYAKQLWASTDGVSLIRLEDYFKEVAKELSSLFARKELTLINTLVITDDASTRYGKFYQKGYIDGAKAQLAHNKEEQK